MRFARVDVLGVPVDVVSASEVLDFIGQRVEEHQPGQIVTVNVECAVLAQRGEEFAGILRRAALSTPDSVGIVWAMRRQGAKLEGRVGGSDLIWSISEQASRLGHKLFLLGAADGVAKAAASKLSERFPSLEIAGSYAGSPSRSDEEVIVDLIRRSEADILLVAYGAPQQDTWIARNLEATGVSVAMGVGGSFDYVAGKAKRAPRLMQEANLDWLWRLVRQPWRARRMLALPKFVWLIWRRDKLAQRNERTS
jgi:N-acetylglucosaminyldiphosphoundecaprenol N-acetyl-beta-D-mannosaminyltransferase